MNNEELINTFNFLKEHFPENFEELYTSFDFFVENLKNTNNTINQELSQRIANGNLDNDLFANAKSIDDLLKEFIIIKDNFNLDIEQQENISNIKIENIDIETTSNINTKQNEQQSIKINYNDYKVDTTIEHYLSEDFTNKRPYAFLFQNSNKIKISNWKDLYFLICEILLKQNPNKFENLRFILKGKKAPYITYNSSELRKFKKLSNGLFIETNISAIRITNILKFMLKEYGIAENELKIYLNADYTDLH